MKINIYNISLTFCLCLFALVGYSQKQIHLMHGMGGSIGSWESLDEKLQNCPGVITTNGTYTSNDGMSAYRDDLLPVLNGASAGNTDLAICHSFGGLVARSLDQDNLNLFGGYITVGTPHHGAKLANSALGGQLENYLEDGCEEVVQGPVDALTDLIVSIPLNGWLLTVNSVVDELLEVMCDNLFEGLMIANQYLPDGGFTGPSMVSVDQLRVGGAGANLDPASLPAIGVTGLAQSPVHWNLVSDFSGDDVTGMMLDAEDNMYGAAGFFSVAANTFRPRWYNPASWITAQVSYGMRNLSDELAQSAQWIANSEHGYVDLIGANGGYTVVETEVEVALPQPCTFDGECNDNQACVEGFCYTFGNNSGGPVELGMGTMIITEYIPNPDLPNDGVVLLSSQNFPGALVNLSPVIGVTHFAQPKDQRIHTKISQQLDLSNSINPIFKVANCSF